MLPHLKNEIDFGTPAREAAGTVTLKSLSAKAKNHPLLTPGASYDIALRLDGLYTTFCSFIAPKAGSAVKCAAAKKTARNALPLLTNSAASTRPVRTGRPSR